MMTTWLEILERMTRKELRICGLDKDGIQWRSFKDIAINQWIEKL